MGTLPIISSTGKTPLCLPRAALPADYMGDFSVLGLKVTHYAEAVQVLTANRVAVKIGSTFSELTITDKEQIIDVVRLLKTHHIDCTLTDIVDQIYQG